MSSGRSSTLSLGVMEKYYEIPKEHCDKAGLLPNKIQGVLFAIALITLFSPINSIETVGVIILLVLAEYTYFHIYWKHNCEKDRKTKLYIVPEGIKFRWLENESTLKFSNVETVKIIGPKVSLKKIQFIMKNGSNHIIANYNNMEDFVTHIESKIESHNINYEKYT